MKKSSKILLTLGATAAVATGLTIYGYMDIMASEKKVPPGLLKRVAVKANEKNMQRLSGHVQKEFEWLKTQNRTKVERINNKGIKLSAYITKPEKESKTFVLFAHGYRADNEGDPTVFARYYLNKGYNLFAVDHVTAGESEGDYLGFDYFESLDLLDWCDYLVDTYGDDISIILHGVSMGGATVCRCADSVPKQVKMIISDCAFVSANEQFDFILKGAGIKYNKPILKVFNALNKTFAGFDLELTDVRNSLKNAKVPMLFVHGTADDFVPTNMVHILYGCCTSEKELLLIKDAMHAESFVVDPDTYSKKLDEFITKHI